jgi:hypothetical protein
MSGIQNLKRWLKKWDLNQFKFGNIGYKEIQYIDNQQVIKNTPK